MKMNLQCFITVNRKTNGGMYRGGEMKMSFFLWGVKGDGEVKKVATVTDPFT